MESLLFGDLAGLPPQFLTATQGEGLLNNATRLAGRAEKAGVEVTLRTLEEVGGLGVKRHQRRNETRPQAAEQRASTSPR